MEKSVAIYSSKTNEKLCNIEAPQKWWADLLSSYQTWKDPEVIRKWAWQQAHVIVVHLNEIGVTKPGDILPSDFRCSCLICGKDSIVTFAKHWIWSRKFKLQGFACLNPSCTMNKVIVPLVLCSRIDEIPLEYLPDGWDRPTRD